MSKECEIIHEFFNSLKRISFPNKNKVVDNGIYVIFEKGEKSHGTNRIVRVGTHTGESQLNSRLQQHFINENKDRSIFRKNIGRALLNKNKDNFIELWELDLTTKKAKDLYKNKIDFSKQAQIEKEITRYMQDNFSIVIIPMKSKEERLRYESKIISTISSCTECKASNKWLGLSSPKDKIRKSGLWLVNETNKTPLSEKDIEYLRNP
jgi:hypothetical protein